MIVGDTAVQFRHNEEPTQGTLYMFDGAFHDHIFSELEQSPMKVLK